jgi:hypothetical protein
MRRAIVDQIEHLLNGGPPPDLSPGPNCHPSSDDDPGSRPPARQVHIAPFNVPDFGPRPDPRSFKRNPGEPE